MQVTMVFSGESSHLAVSTDIVLFTIREHQLNVLLIQRARDPFRGQWALPGGFVMPEESLDECAVRKLDEKTGVSGVYLEQLYTFGDPRRDRRERVITVAYFALVPSDRLKIRGGSDEVKVDWFAMDHLPELAFDHCAILVMAKERLVAKLDYSTIAFQFMPRLFTLSELQVVYETILAQKIDKRNFRKRVLAMQLLEETDKEKRVGACRPAKLYRIKKPNRVDIIK